MNEYNEYYEELKKEYKEILKKYDRGLISKEECIQLTENIEYKMLDIECASGI